MDEREKRKLDFMLECEAQRSEMVESLRGADKALLVVVEKDGGARILFMNTSSSDYLALLKMLRESFNDFDWGRK